MNILKSATFSWKKDLKKEQMAGALYNLTLSNIHNPHHKLYPTLQLADFFIFLTEASSVDFPFTTPTKAVLLRQEN